MTVAEKVAAPVVAKKEEKVEKRRALGRGLESLLPGPRAVVPAVVEPRVLGAERSGVTGAFVQDSAVAGDTKVTRFARDDKSADGNDKASTGSVAVQLQPEVIPIQAPSTTGQAVVNLSIELIDKNPYQTRYVFDEKQLMELRDSIREQGVVQPVVVRPAEVEGRFVLVLGERRLRASKLAGKDTIPALVRRVSPQQAAEMTVLENVVREDLNPLEQAEAFRVLSQEFHLTQAQIAERIGVSRETVSNYMRLLRLPEKVMKYMLDGQLSFSDARQLLALDNPELIEKLADEVMAKHLKWDEIEGRVRELNGFAAMQRQVGTEEKQIRGARWMDPNVRAAQMEMERTLGVRVRIKDRNGKGRIVIEYATVDDYERVVEMLRGKK